MAKFIEFQGYNDDRKICINLDQITSFHKDFNKDFTVINVAHDDEYYGVQENYDTVKAIIGDRYNIIRSFNLFAENEPLTIDDFSDIIGLPVWSMVENKWYIVSSCPKGMFTVYLVDDLGNKRVIGINDIFHLQFYRIKQK